MRKPPLQSSTEAIIVVLQQYPYSDACVQLITPRAVPVGDVSITEQDATNARHRPRGAGGGGSGGVGRVEVSAEAPSRSTVNHRELAPARCLGEGGCAYLLSVLYIVPLFAYLIERLYVSYVEPLPLLAQLLVTHDRMHVRELPVLRLHAFGAKVWWMSSNVPLWDLVLVVAFSNTVLNSPHHNYLVQG